MSVNIHYGVADMIFSIHYLRGIAALLVVLFHFRDKLNNVYAQKDLGDLLFGGGLAGVDLFFLISGFIIVFSTKKQEVNDVLFFFVRRFFRIYPLLIVSCLLYYLVTTEMMKYSTTDGLRKLFVSMIPINLNWKDEAPYFGYNLLYPAWTITYEMAFYLIFGISLWINHRFRTVISSCLILAFVCAAHIYSHGEISTSGSVSAGLFDDSVLLGFVNVITSPMMFEFIVGMIIGEAFIKIQNAKLNSERVKNISFIACMISLATCFIMFFSKVPYGHGVLGFGILAIIITIPLLFAEKVNGIAKNKVLHFLGDISYSLYMCHAIILAGYMYLYTRLNVLLYINGISLVVMLCLASISLAYLLHTLIEIPFINYAKNTLKNYTSQKIESNIDESVVNK